MHKKQANLIDNIIVEPMRGRDYSRLGVLGLGSHDPLDRARVYAEAVGRGGGGVDRLGRLASVYRSHLSGLQGAATLPSRFRSGKLRGRSVRRPGKSRTASRGFRRDRRVVGNNEYYVEPEEDSGKARKKRGVGYRTVRPKGGLVARGGHSNPGLYAELVGGYPDPLTEDVVMNDLSAGAGSPVIAELLNRIRAVEDERDAARNVSSMYWASDGK